MQFQKDLTQDTDFQRNSFGLSRKYLEQNKGEPFDQRYIVIFVADGQTFKRAKSFKYNLKEIF